MASVIIRESNGARFVNIPGVVLIAMGLEVGSKLNITVNDNQIVLTPDVDGSSLDDLLKASPKQHFRITDEDQEWLRSDKHSKEY